MVLNKPQLQPQPHPARLSDNGKTWFLLGREPLLSAAEIFSLLGPDAYELSPPILVKEGIYDPALILNLGGTIKIAHEIGSFGNEETMLSAIKNELLRLSGKITYGFSAYSPSIPLKKIENWGKELKKALKEEGRSARYIFKNETTLSSVTVERNDLTKDGCEFLVIEKNKKLFVAVTKSVQPFESFGERDYGRPGRDQKSGMLPPKLALMLINLTNPRPQDVLLDPFCGSGTILGEAVLLGLKHVSGSDLSEKAIADTNQNILWLLSKHPELNVSWSAEKADVRELGAKSADIIVAEPYLGKPLKGNETELELKKEAAELRVLYLAAFTRFKKILRPNGRIVFIIPRFMTRGASANISDTLLPELTKMGFKAEPLLPSTLSKLPYLIYRRPDQSVAREIWKFTL
jgi:tRNA (guanine10-N2)-dimethyltransferase